MTATSITVSSFPRKPGHIERAVDHLKHYLTYPVSESGQAALARARVEFPGKQLRSAMLPWLAQCCLCLRSCTAIKKCGRASILSRQSPFSSLYRYSWSVHAGCITSDELEELGRYNLVDCNAQGLSAFSSAAFSVLLLPCFRWEIVAISPAQNGVSCCFLSSGQDHDATRSDTRYHLAAGNVIWLDVHCRRHFLRGDVRGSGQQNLFCAFLPGCKCRHPQYHRSDALGASRCFRNAPSGRADDRPLYA